MKYTTVEKYELIKRLLSGETLKREAKEQRLCNQYLGVLYDRYKKYGLKGLERKPNNYLPPGKEI